MGGISYAQQVELPGFSSLCLQQEQAGGLQSAVCSGGTPSARLEAADGVKRRFFRLCVAPQLDPGVMDVRGAVELVLRREAAAQQ